MPLRSPEVTAVAAMIPEDVVCKQADMTGVATSILTEAAVTAADVETGTAAENVGGGYCCQ